jgi:2-dehydropantoate 2-reductase
MDGSRILVAGAGALGSLYGAFLRRAGHHVTLLGRAAHLEAIHDRGLAVDGVFGEAAARGFELATDAKDVGGPFDLIVLAVKSYAVEPTAKPLEKALGESGRLLALQNGLGHVEALTALVGAHRLLAAPVLIGATVPGPCRVRATVYAKPVKIGSPSPRGLEGARRWAQTLSAAGIPSEPITGSSRFSGRRCSTTCRSMHLGALLRVPYGALAERAESRRIMDDVIGEAFAVARAEGADLLWPDAAACREHFYGTLLPPTVEHRSSMLQDLENGRRTQIDALNGYVVERASAFGLPTPQNLVLTGLVHAIESRSRGALLIDPRSSS